MDCFKILSNFVLKIQPPLYLAKYDRRHDDGDGDKCLNDQTHKECVVEHFCNIWLFILSKYLLSYFSRKTIMGISNIYLGLVSFSKNNSYIN